MSDWLVDTGPLVAYLDARDPEHQRVVQALDAYRGQLFTTGAVITEAMHFVSPSPAGGRLLVDFVASTRMQVFDLAQPAVLQEAAALMERYADTPMDYADATLVLLAVHLGTFDVLTLDRRGFSTYRAEGNQAFRLVLDLP